MNKTIHIIFFLQVVLLNAQSTTGVLESMALKEFKPANNNIWWLKDMSGHIGFVHPIRIVLATDNKMFKGAYEMLNSGERFNLEGNFEGNEIVLIETDSLDRVTGYIKGDIIDDKFYARWSDPKNFNTLPIYVSGQKRQELCGSVGWAKYFVNQEPNNDNILSLVIIKNEDKYDAIINYQNKSVNVILEEENKDGLLLRYVPEAFSDGEEMIFDLKNNQIKFLAKKSRAPLNFFIKKELKVNCKSLLNFDHNISYTYPVLGDKKFDDYISTNIVSKYMQFSKESYKPHNDFSISERGQHHEIGNFRFNYLNDTLVSGVFVFQSSRHPEILEIPFNYIFKSKKECTFNEGFIDKYDFNKDVLDYLTDYKTKSNSEIDFSPNKYSIFLFHNNGLKVKTPFDIINGEDAIVIPYAYFTSKLKKKSFYK